MFIVHTKDGKQFREGSKIKGDQELTWDDIPNDVIITQIQLTYPFRVDFKNPDGSSSRKVAPLLTIGKYDKYYFSNEAIVKMLTNGTSPTQIGQTQLEAKIVGGIDETYKLVVETRLDKTGNTTIFRYPLKDLEDRIKAGTFRKDIIRSGVNN